MSAHRRNFAASLVAPGVALAMAFIVMAVAAPAGAQTQGRDVQAVQALGGQVPGAALGANSDAQFWRAVRRGLQGKVSIPNKQAGVMIQSEGDNWRAWRNGPMTVYGIWALVGTIGLLALFFALRGRIKIDAGPSGQTVERFNFVERSAHWLTAVAFILLALTGLNLLYGRHILLPVLGPETFSAITMAGKYVHNYIAFAFMAGIVLMFVLWVRHNIPNKNDLTWMAKGGGLFVKGVHPPSEKFNAGQKVIFWSVVLGGGSLVVSGVSLLFPFEIALFEGTFAILNVFGADLPSALTPLQEMQYAQLWHTLMSVAMIAIVLAHIYIGSLGMEGAFAAMGSGQVDENWAREHHSLWLESLHGEINEASASRRQPAE